MELANIVGRVDELKNELDGLRPIREDYLHKLNLKLRLDWNYHSNSIEGNTLSLSETKSFILWGVTAKGKPFRDYVEMKGHNEALQKLFDIVHQDIKITENLIKEFHKLILVEPYTDNETAEINPGHWKKNFNYLYSPTGERIDFEPPEKVPALMSDLVNWVNNQMNPPKRKKKKYDLHPLLIASGFHTRFINIHPFGDGNGRMARILTNLILMACGYVPAIIKQDRRESYYTAINTSSLDDPENLAIYLGEALIESLELTIKAAKGESIEEKDDLDKELELLNRKLKAKGLEVPLKSVGITNEILLEHVIPFFEEVIIVLSKFQKVFKHAGYQVKLGGGYLTNISPDNLKAFIKKNPIRDRNRDEIILEYSYSSLKNIANKTKIQVNIAVHFLEEYYTYSNNITNKTISLSYNQRLSEKVQRDWIKEIQKNILAKIKDAV